MKIITRKEAREKGLKRYLTGRPCKRGHISERYTTSLQCLDCLKLTDAAYKKAWKKNNPISSKKAINKAAAKWKKSNVDHGRDYSRQWYKDNLKRARANSKRWAQENPDKARAICARRYAKKKQALPVWANKELIDDIYLSSRKCEELTGIPMQVDHVFPICGKYVCGLHTHENLRVIPAICNQEKNNNMPVPEGLISPMNGFDLN